MIEFQVFIPVLSNEGEAFSPQHDSVFEDFLLSHFGGFSRMAGLVAGAWRDGGFTYKDASRVYVVAVESIFDSGKVREAAEFAKRHYGQLAIYIRYMGLSETV